MGNCFSKFCCPIPISIKPILEIPKIHKEKKEITIEYVPLLNIYEAHI